MIAFAKWVVSAQYVSEFKRWIRASFEDRVWKVKIAAGIPGIPQIELIKLFRMTLQE